MRPSYCAECNGALDPYLPECPHCGVHLEYESSAHHDGDLQLSRGQDRKLEVHRKWKLHVPWGLFVVLGLYGGASYAYALYTDRTSPETRAAQHLVIAERILGKDNGESAKPEKLQKAYAELVEALAINPDDAWGHEELEHVAFELGRRGMKPPAELKRRADFLAAARAQQVEASRSNFPEGPVERFGLDVLEDRAVRAKRYIGLGGFVIILLWSYKELQDYKFSHKRDDEHELLHREELRELGAHRKR